MLGQGGIRVGFQLCAQRRLLSRPDPRLLARLPLRDERTGPTLLGHVALDSAPAQLKGACDGGLALTRRGRTHHAFTKVERISVHTGKVT
jgi:hypothetical protein